MDIIHLGKNQETKASRRNLLRERGVYRCGETAVPEKWGQNFKSLRTEFCGRALKSRVNSAVLSEYTERMAEIMKKDK